MGSGAGGGSERETLDEFEASMTPRDVARMLDSRQARLLDVRTPGEYAAAHIRGAYNVPLDALGRHAAEIGAIDTPLVLVCQSGVRARQAHTMLAGSGATRFRLLEGGMQGWMSDGLPVVRGRASISLERQVRIAAGTLALSGALLALVATPWFAIVPALVGGGLVFSGVTDTCGMAMLLARLPYNRRGASDTAAVVRALRAGDDPSARPVDAGCRHAS
jgi:rhodanese-related sulfurtransferase